MQQQGDRARVESLSGQLKRSAARVAERPGAKRCPLRLSTLARWLTAPANLFLAVLLAIAVWRVVVPNPNTLRLQSFVGQELEIGGKLYDDPDVAADGLMKVRFRTSDGVQVFASFKSPATTVERGDTIRMRGKLGEGFGAFAGSIYRGQLVDHQKSDPPDFFLKIRNWFSGHVTRHISEPESSLGLGYLLGQKRALPATLLGVLAITGLTHIVVASGANLTTITRLMKRLNRKSRRRALVSALLAVSLMVGMIGFAPSLVRASIVSLIALIAWYFGRPVHPVRLILLAAATTLIANPTFLVDLGWQLSFAAFGGVLLIAPVLTRFFYGEAKPRMIPQIALETISATILTLPILLYNFGSFSILTLIPNLLILPTIPLAMLLTFLTGGLAIFLAPLATLTGSLATLILRYHLAVINFFGELEFATVEITLTLSQVALAYALVLGIWLILKRLTQTRLLNINIIE